METEWKPSSTSEGVFEGQDRTTGEVKWTGTTTPSSPQILHPESL
jgi:catalase (peroxidase I)